MAIMTPTEEEIPTKEIIIKKETTTPHTGKTVGIILLGDKIIQTTDTQDSLNKNSLRRTFPTTPNQRAQTKDRRRTSTTLEVLRILSPVTTLHQEGTKIPTIIFWRPLIGI